MVKYSTFLSLFLITTVAFIFFIVFYVNGFFSLMQQTTVHRSAEADPSEVFQTIFSLKIIISIALAALGSFVIRILGIVIVAKSETITENEKVFWIIGFAMMTFITSIIFLILAKSKKLLE